MEHSLRIQIYILYIYDTSMYQQLSYVWPTGLYEWDSTALGLEEMLLEQVDGELVGGHHDGRVGD